MSFGVLMQAVEGFGVFEIQGHGWTLDELMPGRLAGLPQAGPRQSLLDVQSADEKEEAQSYAGGHWVPDQRAAGRLMSWV